MHRFIFTRTGSYLLAHAPIPHKPCGFQAHAPSPGFAVPTCTPRSAEDTGAAAVQVSMLLAAAPKVHVGKKCPAGRTPESPCLPPPAARCWPGAGSSWRPREGCSTWAGQWCPGVTSGRTESDFYCFSISFCLSLTHCSSLLLKRPYIF